jgi:hypothetical protein
VTYQENPLWEIIPTLRCSRKELGFRGKVKTAEQGKGRRKLGRGWVRRL